MDVGMKRREFLFAIGGAAACPTIAAAQSSKRMPRIGYLFSFKPEEGKQLWEACRQGLRELGYVEGSNIAIEVRWADGRYERLPELVAELIRLKVEVMVVAATPGSLAVKAATSTIPVVIVRCPTRRASDWFPVLSTREATSLGCRCSRRSLAGSACNYSLK
jgi:putative ABC transport system substrate-binding protein